MANINNTIEVIDLLLSAIELRKKPWPAEVKSHEFPRHLSHYEIDKILSSLENKKIIRNLRPLNTPKNWRLAIADFVNDYRITFDADRESLETYKNDLSKTPVTEETKKEIRITYNINIGRFIFNENGKIDLTGKQKDVATCLVEHGKEVPVSWDEIHDTFKDEIDDGEIPTPTQLGSRKRSVRTAVTDINLKTQKYLEKNKDLIEAKDNEYWLQYEVDKGR